MWSTSSHVGPWWRHQPSLKQSFLALLVAVPLIAVVITFAFPSTSGDATQEIGRFVVVALICVVAVTVSDLIYHRVRDEPQSDADPAGMPLAMRGQTSES